jgi:hypothetical protein
MLANDHSSHRDRRQRKVWLLKLDRRELTRRAKLAAELASQYDTEQEGRTHDHDQDHRR